MKRSIGIMLWLRFDMIQSDPPHHKKKQHDQDAERGCARTLLVCVGPRSDVAGEHQVDAHLRIARQQAHGECWAATPDCAGAKRRSPSAGWRAPRTVEIAKYPWTTPSSMCASPGARSMLVVYVIASLLNCTSQTNNDGEYGDPMIVRVVQ